MAFEDFQIESLIMHLNGAVANLAARLSIGFISGHADMHIHGDHVYVPLLLRGRLRGFQFCLVSFSAHWLAQLTEQLLGNLAIHARLINIPGYVYLLSVYSNLPTKM